ncbi:hypothetical protein QTG54_004207 [Skeletonema marinoi]|uniref:Uncharacterized protein n=1 Tax=Skeletonema marinoi TaxID=267567 RepID=A0AAD8YGU6_9STRA|nr:hypothetical protein QTG54_004207 [Skeletonema marinoi]
MVETSSLNNAVAIASKSYDSNNKRARTGKLSSRNTRRKRRDHKIHSAKKLKPPIPSFSCSPIIEEEDEEVENEASTSLNSPSQKVPIKSKPLKATVNTAEEASGQAEIRKREPHESIIDDTTSAAEDISGVYAANDNLLQKKEANVRSVSTSSAIALDDGIDGNSDNCDEPIDTAQKAVNTAQKTVNHAPPPTELTSQKLSKQKNKLPPCESASLAHAPTSNRKPKEQHSKKKDTCSNTKAPQKVFDMVEVANPEKQRSTRCNAIETIEILDDEEEHTETDPPLVSTTNSINISAAEKAPAKPKIQSKKRKRPETDPISVDSSDDESIIAPKKTKTVAKKKKPARQKPAAAKSKSESKSPANESSTGTLKRTRKKLCTTCASCNCQAKDGSATFPQKLPTLSLSGSGARVEQTLKNRMLKIERNIAWTESQRHECARELKRHRGTLQKKFCKTGANTAKRQHFLADAQVTEEMAQAFATARLDRKEVKQIQTRVFGKRSSQSKKEPQPTLTQMFGGGTDGDEDKSDDALSAKEDDQSCNGDTSSADESSQADPHDSFWNDESVHATHQFIGSMSQFNEATTRFRDKQMHSTAAWTKATSKVIKNEVASQSCEEEEGIDALVELFDLSPKKTPGSMNCHDQECNDSFLQSQLSQSGAIAVQSITEEIAKDEAKRVAIERACPHWRENVEYSFRRKDSDGLENALNQLKKERRRLEDAKDRILQAFLERSSTLDVYEKAIEGSLTRLAEKENGNT